MNKQHAGIIGMGRIANKYLHPITASDALILTAISDINESVCKIASQYHVPFYKDYQKMLCNEEIDLIIITTPPATHFDIAKTCLLHGKNVILEKPAVFYLKQLQILFNLATEKGLVFDVIFHWKYGNELLYLKDKLKDLGEITCIESTVFDPYTDANWQVKKKNAAMGGSWLDSGINCLSLVSEFVDIGQMKLVEKHFLFDVVNNIDIYSKHRYRVDGVNVSITVDWRYHVNHKYTCIYLKKDVLYVDHSEQSVFLNNELLANLNDGDRLKNHYRNYLERFDGKQVKHEEIYQIHARLIKDGTGNF